MKGQKDEQESSTQSSSKGHDFSSDEAKESEGDSDQVDKKNNNTSESNKTTVKYSCDSCNITVNSTTQLSQVRIIIRISSNWYQNTLWIS